MNYRNTLHTIGVIMILGFAGNATATGDTETLSKAEQAELQARLETEYEQAMSLATKERQAAQASMEKAREKLKFTTEERIEATAKSARTRTAQHAEMEKMHEELNKARRQLQEASREIARVNREVSRARSDRTAYSFAYGNSERPVIGVILGDANDVGVKVLGVSPDGPSERGGISQGDVIVAIGGRVLAAIEEAADAREGLLIAMRDIKAEEPLTITVERDERTLDLTVTPEIREPLTWQTVTRFPSAHAAPESPEHVIKVERIVVPEIDTVEIARQIEKMRVDIDERRTMMEVRRFEPIDGEYEFEFHDLSEMGNMALQDANMWFGLPMAQGLKLAELNPGLGAYFQAERGVLVLKARDDNDLQLESGDVILQVGDTEVNSPAEFMRALRSFEAGDVLQLEIKRDRNDRTLKTVMPEDHFSFSSPHEGKKHIIKITTETD